ncbi:MAG TPA: tetratricopeptide repeat protein [Candidatus Angelobacter sp.]|jgi:tetratricopeptide (TPR) repeat protein
MKYRFHILAAILIGFTLHGAQRAAAQDNQDNSPHIQPRATPTPSPTPKASPAQQKPEQYERPPFPGDAPGTRPAEPPPASKTPDGYERPPFPGDAPGTNPTTGSAATGESSSSDSQIDLNVRRKEEAAPAPDDVDELKPWDPHKAAKDVEVGNYYLKLKNYRAALERFNHALEYKPNDAEATYGLAVTQEKLGLLSLAGKNYSKYLELLPDGPKSKEAREAIGRLEPQEASLKPAGSSADAAKEAAHDINVGETYLSANNYDAARERFEEALRLNPENPLACFRLAQSLQGMQRLDPARMYYRKYLELEPKGKFVKTAKKAIDDINWILGK